MVKNDPKYFRDYYIKHREAILEHKKKRYQEDDTYRKKIKTKAYFFRRLSTIFKYLEALIKAWRNGQWQKWMKGTQHK